MNDSIVRKSFHQLVLGEAHSDKETLVYDEFSLKNGASRVDIAVLNGKMVGYEIKTEGDTLLRLTSQINAYNEVFDHVYLITATKHLEKAMEMIPDWWGIFIIIESNNKPHFKLFRKSKKNNNKKALGVLQLLWREEIINLLNSSHGVQVKYNQPKRELYEIARHAISLTKLSKMTLKYIKNRERWRKDQKVLL